MPNRKNSVFEVVKLRYFGIVEQLEYKVEGGMKWRAWRFLLLSHPPYTLGYEQSQGGWGQGLGEYRNLNVGRRTHFIGSGKLGSRNASWEQELTDPQRQKIGVRLGLSYPYSVGVNAAGT